MSRAMQDTSTSEPTVLRNGGSVDSLEMDEILRRLILDEIRRGRLTRSARRRLTRFTAGMGVDAATTAQLLASCRDHVIRTGTECERARALRSACGNPHATCFPYRVATLIILACAAQFALLRLLE